MKNLLTLAILLSSATAFATRARLISLGGSPHLSDTMTVFTNPADMTGYKDSLTLETGSSNMTYTASGTSSLTGSEGLLIRSMGDAKFGFGLGHDNQMVFSHRNLYADAVGYPAATTAVLTQQNPFTVAYASKSGDMAWGASLDYSNFNNKTTGSEMKESSMGLNFGARTAQWDAALNLLLGNTWESGTGATKSDIKGNTGFSISGGYNVDSDMYVYGNIVSGGFKSTIAGADSVNYEQMNMSFGVVNTIKQDANEFFYGVGLSNTSLKEKTGDSKSTTMGLPFIIGLEADAASWLTLRGSISQTVLINDEKSTTGATTNSDLSPAGNNTNFAAGAGLKFASVTLDGSILTTQNINSANLLGQVGLTYNF